MNLDMSIFIAACILAVLWAWFVDGDPMVVLCTIFTSLIFVMMFGLSACGGGDQPAEPQRDNTLEIRRPLPNGGQVQP